MASAFPAGRIRRFATGLLLLLLVAAPVVGAVSPGSDSGSAPSSGRVAPVVTSFAAALAFEADHPALPPPEEEPPGWWLRLSAEDRALIAPVEYEDPLAILAAKKWHARWARQAREAVAAGRTPPAPPKPIDSPSGHAITPAAGAIPEPAAGENATPDEQRGAGAAPAGEPNGPSSTAALAAPAPSPQRAPVQPDAPGWYSSFAGMSTGWRPSDSTVAVGPAHVGAVVNSSLAFYTKDGTATVGPVSLGSWFSGAPIPGDLFDPKIVYDRWTGHWVVLALNGRDGDPENYYAVSVSQTNDPEGGWWTWYLRSDIDGGTDTTAWTDYPGLGYDSGDATNGPTGGAIYITSNQYGSGGGGFLRGKARVIPKYQIETGSSVGWWDFWNASVFAWKPASTDSSTGASPIEYLANTQSAGGSSLTLWTLTNPLGAGPSLGSTTVGSSVYGVPPNAEQLGGSSSSHLDTGDCRTQDVQFRNGFVFLTAGDYSFWSDVFDTDAVVHYWKINASSGAAVWDGYFGSNDEYFFFGKIAVDPSSNAHVVFSHSSPSTYARIGVTGILAADGLVQSYSIVGTGTATYDVPADSLERWGDYNGLGFDCAGDETGSWAMSQVATSATSWQTWLAGQSFGRPNVTHLSDGLSLLRSDAPRWFTWKILSGDWSGVGIAPTAGGDQDLAASSTCPFGAGYQSSAFGGTTRDFVVANGTQLGTVYHHAKVTLYTGTAGYRVEARSSSVDLAVGSTSSGSIGTTEVLRLFEAPLVSGKSYAAVFDSTSGTLDTALFAFRGSRTSGRRSDNDGGANAAGAGGDETLLLTPSESSTYGFAVTNENAGSGSFTFRIWLKPLVSAISNASIPGGASYSGPTPSLAEGTTPVTWTLDSGPPGMTINGSTGVVSWTAGLVNATYSVTIRATNPAGYSTATWTLTVMGAPGRVPDGRFVPGTPLRATRAGGNVSLVWSGSCNPSATNYEVYEGVLGSFTSHVAKLCSTGGAVTATFAPGSADRYWLVVPTAWGYEGSYGLNSSGVERPRASSPCLAPTNTAACP